MLNLILILIIILAVFLAALFSGLETGMYQLSRLRLRLGAEKKRWSFIVLARMMRDSPGLLISMLVGTNLVYYITTSAVTYMLLSKLHTEHTAMLLATLLTAPILFIFSEVIPKNIFFYRADILMPRFAFILLFFHKLFTWCGIVPLLKIISHLFARFFASARPGDTFKTPPRQSYLKAILRETDDSGFFSPVQAGIINRLDGILHQNINSVMIPVGKAKLVSKNCNKKSLLKMLRKHSFTRLPVYDGTAANIVGFINVYDCLNAREEFDRLDEFIKPILSLDARTIVIDAIDKMRTENQKIVLVTKPAYADRTRPLGLITMKDLAEELVGELAQW